MNLRKRTVDYLVVRDFVTHEGDRSSFLSTFFGEDAILHEHADGDIWTNPVDVDDGYQFSAPVGSYPEGASPYGVLDTAGNVWEWMSSEYAGYPYDPVDGREQMEGDDDRTLRGGSWYSTYFDVSSTRRENWHPQKGGKMTGFRVIRYPSP